MLSMALHRLSHAPLVFAVTASGSLEMTSSERIADTCQLVSHQGQNADRLVDRLHFQPPKT
jgi:hypothetical protein